MTLLEEMISLQNNLLAAIEANDIAKASRLLEDGCDLNLPCSELQGAPALFLAILKGDVAMVQLLLEHGADPNYRAEEPPASIYAEHPLNLAKQARMLFDWDQYHPIVLLLQRHGAIEEDRSSDPDELERIKAEAKKWQSQRTN